MSIHILTGSSKKIELLTVITNSPMNTFCNEPKMYEILWAGNIMYMSKSGLIKLLNH